MADRPDIGPSNSEFFEFLARDLAFSIFSRSGSVLTSFKTTIEFVFVPEGTAEGPEEGVLYEGSGPMSYAAWSDLVAAFPLSAVESLHEDGRFGRVYHGGEAPADAPALPPLRRDGMVDWSSAPVREELVCDRARYIWIGAARGDDAGRVLAWVRRIACRGADKGLPAQLLFRDKLCLYERRRQAP